MLGDHSLRLDSTEPKYLTTRALVNIALGEIDRIIEDYSQALQLVPSNKIDPLALDQGVRMSPTQISKRNRSS